MSIVATNLRHSFCRSSNRPQDRILANNQPQLKRQNSAQKSEQPHVTKKEIQTKQLIKETTVAATRAEVKSEDVKDNQQSQGSKERIQKELNCLYVNAKASSATKDYHTYQNGNVKDFFEKNTIATAATVADICLVNDHFILVKILAEHLPIYHNKLNESAMSHKNFRELKRVPKCQNESRRLCCCLRSKRNRITKIAPIDEEDEVASRDDGDFKSKSNCLRMPSCWQANEPEVEMYQTETKMYTSVPNTIDNRAKALTQTNSPAPAAESPHSLDCEQTSDIPTISGSLLKSSLQYQVALHQYSCLLDSQSNNVSTLSQLEMANRARHRKSPRLDSFYWLLRPFRRKCRKTEPKVQAIVHKTYFVKWTKPPDTLTCGYGVKPRKPSSVLRRCRSALF